MTQQDILNEVGRRLGDTSTYFTGTILSPIFSHVLRELALNDCIRSLRKSASFTFTADTRSYNTQTICGLTGSAYTSGSSAASTQYPIDIQKLIVPAWGIGRGILERVSEEEFDRFRLANTDSDGNPITNQPQRWRLYPNEQQLQVDPVPSSDWATDTVEVTFIAPPAVLGTSADITEIRDEHMPVIIAGMVKHGLKFADETLPDLKYAPVEFAAGMLRMKAQANRAKGYARRTQYRDW